MNYETHSDIELYGILLCDVEQHLLCLWKLILHAIIGSPWVSSPMPFRGRSTVLYDCHLWLLFIIYAALRTLSRATIAHFPPSSISLKPKYPQPPSKHTGNYHMLLTFRPDDSSQASLRHPWSCMVSLCMMMNATFKAFENWFKLHLVRPARRELRSGNMLIDVNMKISGECILKSRIVVHEMVASYCTTYHEKLLFCGMSWTLCLVNIQY